MQYYWYFTFYRRLPKCDTLQQCNINWVCQSVCLIHLNQVFVNVLHFHGHICSVDYATDTLLCQDCWCYRKMFPGLIFFWTQCTLSLKFGELLSSTPRDYEVTNFIFWDVRQKLAFPSNISEFAGPIFTKFSGLVGTFVGMIDLTFVLRLHVTVVTN